MKKIISFVVLGMLLGFAATAQLRRTPAAKPAVDSAAAETATSQRGKHGQRKMIKELNLDKEQKEKLKTMKEEAKAEKDAIAADDKLTAAEKKQKQQELRRKQAEKLNGVLTDEQKEKLKKVRLNKRKEAAPEQPAQQ